MNMTKCMPWAEPPQRGDDTFYLVLCSYPHKRRDGAREGWGEGTRAGGEGICVCVREGAREREGGREGKKEVAREGASVRERGRGREGGREGGRE